MLYEEGKLLYFSEECHEIEVNGLPAKSMEDKTVQTLDDEENAPLILPKSTLPETQCNPPPGFANLSDPVGLSSFTTHYVLNAANTSQEEFYIPPDRKMTWSEFVEVSNKSLELQIQISQAFNTVLLKILRNSQNSYPGYVANSQVPPTNINPHVLPNGIANLNVHDNGNMNPMTKFSGFQPINTNPVSIDNKCPTWQGIEQGPRIHNPPSDNVKSNSFISSNPFRTTVPAPDTSKDFKVINGSYCENSINEINVTPGAPNGLPREQPKSPTDFSNSFKTNTPVSNVIHQNGVENNNHNISDSFTPRLRPPKTKNVFVETNPFKLGLIDKLQEPEPNESETQSLLGEHYKSPLTKNCSGTLNRTTDVEQAYRGLLPPNNRDLSVLRPAHYLFDGNSNVLGNNLWSSNAKNHLNSDSVIEESALYNGTVKENITSTPKIHYEKNQGYLPSNKTENYSRTQADLYDFSIKGSRQGRQDLFNSFIDQNHFLRQTSINIDTDTVFVDEQISKKQRKETQSPEGEKLHKFLNGYPQINNGFVKQFSELSLNPTAPVWTHVAGLTTPLTIEKSPIDEGYQTGSTTTTTLQSSTPLLKIFSENKNENQVLGTKPTDSKKSNSNSRQVHKSPETTERKQSPHPRYDVYKCGLDMFCRTVDLPNAPVNIFHYSGEGWILTEDFVDVFTDLKTVTYMINLLPILDMDIGFKEVAVTDLMLLGQSDSKLEKNAEGGERGDATVHLMPLKSTIKVLIKLGVVKRKDIQNVIVKKELIQGSAPHEMISMVIRAYGELLEVIEKGE